MKDYYSILGLQSNATAAEVREKWLLLAKELHPDTNAHPGAGKALAEVNEAYAVLRDTGKRRAYDLKRKVKQFVPKMEESGQFDLLAALCGAAAAGRIPENVINAVAPVLERKLDEHGVNARQTTAGQILEAVGWLKPKRRKRSA
jgi:curved DNA-binding protein CbpA